MKRISTSKINLHPIIFTILAFVIISCSRKDGELIHEGDRCYGYAGCKEVHLKNKSFDDIISFTIEMKDYEKSEPITKSKVFKLNPGERKKIGCACNGRGEKFWRKTYKIVGEHHENK